VEPDDKDWCSAVCADARVENLTIAALQAAHDVAETPFEFWVAVSAAIELKEVMNEMPCLR